ncbi:small ribosomal subunit protein uS12m-like [Physella acuta]|uniref:small ribosomal subunit protein uS12m-like n=1 Tax=Physella acuta TaxID=109671 RepID=UPI0027DD6289|nr:small ribosomal subunit protein uS12m-like [Physella acuta]
MSLFGFTKRLGSVFSSVLTTAIRTPLSCITSRSFSAASTTCHSSAQRSSFTSERKSIHNFYSGRILQNIASCCLIPQRLISLEYMHRKCLYKKVRRKRLSPLEGNPQLKGIVLKTLIKKPKKPNSANRKCVRVRLSTGREVTAYVPGEGHNLQEHNIVLVEGGRLQDTPGVKLTCVRGKFDLPHVKKK